MLVVRPGLVGFPVARSTVTWDPIWIGGRGQSKRGGRVEGGEVPGWS